MDRTLGSFPGVEMMADCQSCSESYLHEIDPQIPQNLVTISTFHDGHRRSRTEYQKRLSLDPERLDGPAAYYLT